MVRVLVTGGSGFIGSHLIKRLESLSHEVFNADVRNLENPVDITDFSQFYLAFERFKPDVVIHLAALASVPLCEAEPVLAFETNVVGTLNVVKCTLKYDAKVVFASSAAVYGNPEKLPSSECSPLVPVNCYGKTKLCGEHTVQSIMPTNFVIFRVFNCYGPHCERSYVIPDTIRKLSHANSRVSMLGTGEEARDLIYIDDVLDAFIKAIERDVVGVFNLGTGKSVKIRDLAEVIAKIMGKDDAEFVFEGEMREGDFMVSQADICKARKELGLYPKTDLVKGLDVTVNWWNGNSFSERFHLKAK